MILLVSTVGGSSEDCASVPEFKLQVWAPFRYDCLCHSCKETIRERALWTLHKKKKLKSITFLMWNGFRSNFVLCKYSFTKSDGTSTFVTSCLDWLSQIFYCLCFMFHLALFCWIIIIIMSVHCHEIDVIIIMWTYTLMYKPELVHPHWPTLSHYYIIMWIIHH